jgi:hypothetical protein
MECKTSEYDTLIQHFSERKFTKNDIKSFVHRVFSMYERATVGKDRVPAEAFALLVDEHVQVDFPDYKICSRQEFLEWHRWIHERLLSDDHDIKSIEVSYLANGKYKACFDVRWRGGLKMVLLLMLLLSSNGSCTKLTNTLTRSSSITRQLLKIDDALLHHVQ